jgi:2-iminobutanoate/2-iminopropanoate deaminase
MSAKRIVDPGWPEYARLTYVPAVAARGEVLFTSGLNALGPDGTVLAPNDIVGQARIIYQRLAEILQAAGGSLADVVKTTDYIVTRERYRATAAVREEFLGPDFCAATGVVRELLGRGVLIEIEAVAVLPPHAPADKDPAGAD